MRKIARLVVIVLLLILLKRIGENVMGGHTKEFSCLPQEAYIWQREWGEPVTGALGRSNEVLDGYCVLAAEVSWSGISPRTVQAQIDFSALKRVDRSVGLALRIGPYSGAYCKDDAVSAYLTTQAVTVLVRAKEAGLEVAELQLDFDCAESKLNGYRHWVEVIRGAIRPVPLTITALPCWLEHEAFRTLVKATDGYVLQVHSLAPPTSVDAPIVLCNPEMARKWVMQANSIGVPFRVALSTYGYLVAFGKEGKFIGLAAEGVRRDWEAGTTLRQVRSDAKEMSLLVREWSVVRPPQMTGILWYRLPVEGDDLNWPWETMAAVMKGNDPTSDFDVTSVMTEGGLVEVLLTNTGQTEVFLPTAVMIQWNQGELLTGDGYQGYGLTSENQNHAQLTLSGVKRMSPIAPGNGVKLGWLRFDIPTEVMIYAK